MTMLAATRPADSTHAVAEALLAQLEEDVALDAGAAAVHALSAVVDAQWYAVAEGAAALRRLSRRQHEAGRNADAEQTQLLLARVSFHLGDWGAAVAHALLAGEAYEGLLNSAEVSGALQSECTGLFAQTVLAKAIDEYVAARRAGRESPSTPGGVPLRPLEGLVERVIFRALAAGETRLAAGVSLEAHRVDILSKVLADGDWALLEYVRAAAERLAAGSALRADVFGALLRACSDAPTKTGRMASSGGAGERAVFAGRCMAELGDATGLASLLAGLDDRAVAMQVAYDACAQCSGQTLERVVEALQQHVKDAASDKREDVASLLPVLADGGRGLRQAFLGRACATDVAVLERTRVLLPSGASMHHAALSAANGAMHAGTGNDAFLRRNLDWLGAATHWAKFGAAASLGAVHYGRPGDAARTVIGPYLPGDAAPTNGSEYSEGGALYALGLANAGTRRAAYREELLAQLDRASGLAEGGPVLAHGAALGVGALLAGSGDMAAVDALRGSLYADDAVASEGAAIGLGLVLLGRASSVECGAKSGVESPVDQSEDVLTASALADILDEALAYARETQHEKTVRALGVAVALAHVHAADAALPTADALLAERDAWLRHGGVWTLAAGFAGTGSRAATSRLLHAAVSDSSDDVRRAAVAALGLVYARHADALPPVLATMAASFNPHMRYGAALALGTAYAGTGSARAAALLRPLLRDPADYVRQGACIGLGLVMQLQAVPDEADGAGWARAHLASVAAGRHEDAAARFGAVLAQGLVDAGGRAAVFAPVECGALGIAGAILFSQLWFWFPLAHFFVLALRPAGALLVDAEGRAPVLSLVCAAPPSRFALPPALRDEAPAAPKRLVAAVLSTAARAASRGAAEMTPHLVEVMPGGEDEAKAPPAPMAVDEPETSDVANFGRVTPAQALLVSWPAECRYVPVAPAHAAACLAAGRVIVVVNARGGAGASPAEFVDLGDVSAGSSAESSSAGEADAHMSDAEPAAPAPFAAPSL